MERERESNSNISLLVWQTLNFSLCMRFLETVSMTATTLYNDIGFVGIYNLEVNFLTSYVLAEKSMHQSFNDDFQRRNYNIKPKFRFREKTPNFSVFRFLDNL